jgi:hypothetical protein
LPVTGVFDLSLNSVSLTIIIYHVHKLSFHLLFACDIDRLRRGSSARASSPSEVARSLFLSLEHRVRLAVAEHLVRKTWAEAKSQRVSLMELRLILCGKLT